MGLSKTLVPQHGFAQVKTRHHSCTCTFLRTSSSSITICRARQVGEYKCSLTSMFLLPGFFLASILAFPQVRRIRIKSCLACTTSLQLRHQRASNGRQGFLRNLQRGCRAALLRTPWMLGEIVLPQSPMRP